MKGIRPRIGWMIVALLADHAIGLSAKNAEESALGGEDPLGANVLDDKGRLPTSADLALLDPLAQLLGGLLLVSAQLGEEPGVDGVFVPARALAHFVGVDQQAGAAAGDVLEFFGDGALLD